MSGERFGLMGALNRASVLEDISTGSKTNSAIQASLERDIKELLKDNTSLRNQLEETRSTLAMLLKQSPQESFDERRVNLLKCQLIQQERQMLLLSEALSSRSGVLMEVENALSSLAEKFRSYIALEVKAPDVPVARSDLIRMVETAESARIKLFKSVENASKDNLARPLMMMNTFIRPEHQEEHTLFDVMSGRLEHLNLKHVSQLESKLSQLYKELIRLYYLMADDKNAPGLKCSSHMTAAARERLTTQLLKACAIMKDTADNLLTLSLLFPSAPWPALKRPILKEVTMDHLLSSLPSLPRSKSLEVNRIIEAALKTCNYRYYMLDREVRALREEVKFHQTVYNIQLGYTQSLFQAMSEGYNEFEKSAGDVIVKPLKAVLEDYAQLKLTASEDALRHFLSSFKEKEHQFSEAVEKLSCDQGAVPEEKSMAMTAFGKEFMEAVDKVVACRQNKRDQECHEKQDLRCEQDRLDEELRAILSAMDEEKVKLSQDKTQNITGNRNEETEDNTQNSPNDTPKSNKPVGTTSKMERERSSLLKYKNKSKSENSVRLEFRKSGSNLDISKNDILDSPTASDNESKSSATSAHSSNLSFNTESKAKQPTPVEPGSMHESKLPYKPKLYVPNRTLRLRKSGSLTRLSNSSGQEMDSTMDVSVETIEKSGTSLSTRRKSDIPRSFRKPPFK